MRNYKPLHYVPQTRGEKIVISAAALIFAGGALTHWFSNAGGGERQIQYFEPSNTPHVIDVAETGDAETLDPLEP